MCGLVEGPPCCNSLAYDENAGAVITSSFSHQYTTRQFACSEGELSRRRGFHGVVRIEKSCPEGQPPICEGPQIGGQLEPVRIEREKK